LPQKKKTNHSPFHVVHPKPSAALRSETAKVYIELPPVNRSGNPSPSIDSDYHHAALEIDWRTLMSKKAAEHHHKAAEHHEHAARHHKEAAKYHEAGKHETAAHHAQVANGHQQHAMHHAAEAAKAHMEDHGKALSAQA